MGDRANQIALAKVRPPLRHHPRSVINDDLSAFTRIPRAMGPRRCAHHR